MDYTTVHGWKESILGLLFPEQAVCPLCAMRLRGVARGLGRVRLCGFCAAHVSELTASLCRCCGRAGEGALCGDCARRAHVFFRARAYARYAGAVEQAIKTLKYQGDRRILPVLGDWITKAYLRHHGADRHWTLVPVPMHADKREGRGFNQAEELARMLGRRIHLPVAADALVRRKSGVSQTTHSRAQRIAAMAGTFAAGASDVSGRYVLLVDDVLTTGGTADACASVLFAGGAVAVEVLTVAR